MIDVYIRRLQMGDHLVSYKWRNDPDVWKLTGSRPDRVITEAIEEQWLANVLTQKDTMRFAICIAGPDEYVGNVQLDEHHEAVMQSFTFLSGSGNTGGRALLQRLPRSWWKKAFAAVSRKYTFT
jgi:hypothetical protein